MRNPAAFDAIDVPDEKLEMVQGVHFAVINGVAFSCQSCGLVLKSLGSMWWHWQDSHIV
jgi:hypothetical protein